MERARFSQPDTLAKAPDGMLDDKLTGMIGAWNIDQQIVANVQDGLIVAGRDRRYLAWNPAMVRISGMSAEEVVGRMPLDLFPFLSDIGFESLFERVLAGETLTTPDFAYEVPANGMKGWASQTMAPLRLGNGEVAGVITTVRDITPRRWAERRERQHLRVLELLTTRAPLDEILDFIVRSFENDDPGTLSSILVLDERGQQLTNLVAPNLPADFVTAINELVANEQPSVWQTAARHGIRVLIDDILTDERTANHRDLFQQAGLRACWLQPIVSVQRSVLGSLVVYRPDRFTPSHEEILYLEAAAGYACLAIERTRAEEQRRRLESQFQNSQKLESLGVLAGGIAHDFNNLLTAVLSYAELARMQLDESSPANPMIAEVEQAAERAAELANQMLAYSGRGKFTIGLLQIDQLVAEMAKLLSTVINKKAELRFDLERATIEGDGTQIRQIVMNLITNASDALENKSGTITLRTRVREMNASELRSSILLEEPPPGTYGMIELQDSGCGMSEATLSRIFDPFFTTKPTGRGLGLAAVVGIVRGHRGTIQVDSQPGRGTTFRILFPAIAAAAPENRSRGTSVSPQTSSGTILVVDDEPAVNRMTCQVLTKAGFHVLAAPDGKAGLELFEQHRLDIRGIVLDLSMPHLNGLEVAEQVRKRTPRLPILFISGYNQQDSSERLIEIGQSAFLQKPFRPSLLLDSLRQMISAAPQQTAPETSQPGQVDS